MADIDLSGRIALVTGASRGIAIGLAEVHKLFAVHAAGPHRLSRLALPQLRTHARSDIIINSSIATYVNSPNGAPYTMAKAAGDALALTLAKEDLKNGVRVNIVAPALTVSDANSYGSGQKLNIDGAGQATFR